MAELTNLRREKRKFDDSFQTWLKHHYRRKRYVIIAFAALVLASLYLFQNADFVLRATSSIAFVVMFYIIDRFFDIRFKWYHYLFIILIVVSSLLLSPLYFLHPQYDKVQHLVQPIFVASMVFHMVSKINIRLRWRITFTIFIVIAILTMFEMSEYTLDRVFDWKLQGVYLRDAVGLEKFNLLQEPLDDTIYDLFFGVLGACIYGLAAASGIHYFRKRRVKRQQRSN